MTSSTTRLVCVAGAAFAFALALRAEDVEPPAVPPEKLEEAIATGDHEAVKKLLDDGADANGRGEGAPTSPLTFAILKHAPDAKAMELVKLLHSREADVNQAADLRPLYAAILREDAAMARWLVEAGADADVAGCIRATLPGTTAGESAKALAAKKGEPYVSIVKDAKPMPVKPPKQKELKRRTACSE